MNGMDGAGTGMMKVVDGNVCRRWREGGRWRLWGEGGEGGEEGVRGVLRGVGGEGWL